MHRSCSIYLETIGPPFFLRCSPCMRASPSSWSRDRINLPPTKSVPRRAKILQRCACASASWPLQLGKAAVEVRKVPSLEITLRSSGKRPPAGPGQMPQVSCSHRKARTSSLCGSNNRHASERLVLRGITPTSQQL